MLHHCTHITSSSHMKDVERLLENDPRWLDIYDVRLRDDLVYAYLDDLTRKEKKEKEESTRSAVQGETCVCVICVARVRERFARWKGRKREEKGREMWTGEPGER